MSEYKMMAFLIGKKEEKRLVKMAKFRGVKPEELIGEALADLDLKIAKEQREKEKKGGRK